MAPRKKAEVQQDKVLVIADPHEFTRDQIELMKRTVANDCTDDELQLFLYTAKRHGLDPLAKQIHAIKRAGRMTIQIGIDGYRAIAERTGCYSPGPAPVYTYKDDKQTHIPLSATVTVRKLVAGTWHDVQATAFFREYVQTFKDGNPMGLWAKMPHNQLAKCAETLALRKAFPSLAGLLTDEEMEQADNQAPPREPVVLEAAPNQAPEPAGKGPTREQQAKIRASREAEQAAKKANKAKKDDEEPEVAWQAPDTWTFYMEALLRFVKDPDYKSKVSKGLLLHMKPAIWYEAALKVRQKLVEMDIGDKIPAMPQDMVDWGKENYVYGTLRIQDIVAKGESK